MTRKINVIGVTNKLSEDEFVVFSDYDNHSILEIEEIWTKIIEKFNLTDVHILSTKKRHYWVVSFGIVKLNELLPILYNSRCDVNYVAAFYQLNCNTIRLTQKHGLETPAKYIKTLKGFKTRNVSLKHSLVFNQMFKTPHAVKTNYVDKNIQFNKYQITDKKGSFYKNDFFKLEQLPVVMEHIRKTERGI